MHFCPRHDPARVKALEQLGHDILTRAQEVYGQLDSASGMFFPQVSRISADQAMHDLLEQFLPQYQKLMAYENPLPSAPPVGTNERPP